jgi:phosphoenolpyruvate-protein kinase (PTS system EI component)
MKKLKGIGVSKGIAIGKVFLYLPEELKIDINEKDNIPISENKKRLEAAREE